MHRKNIILRVILLCAAILVFQAEYGGTALYAQDVQLKIIDAVSLTPIEGVNVYCKDKFGTQGGARSGQNGKAVLSNYRFPLMLSISMIGYEKDTIVLTQENAQWKNYGYYYTVLLKAKNIHLKQAISVLMGREKQHFSTYEKQLISI